MKKLKRDEGEEITVLEVKIHPESLAELVGDMKEQGLSDEAIATQIEVLKKQLADDFKKREEDGTLEDEFEECCDLSCPNCYPNPVTLQ